MNNAGSNTHKPRAVDPKTFRDAATGVGQSFSASVATGAHRSQCVIDAAPKKQRAVADPSYPQPTAVFNDGTGRMHHPDTGVIVSPVALGRGGL